MKAKNHLHISNRFQAITERIPNAPCIIQGDSILSYADVELHSDRLAKAYLDAGIERGDTVAIMGRNSAGYIEACLAAHKLACLPCNIDLKNSAHKVLYLLKNSSATVLVIDAEFYPVYQELAENLSFIKLLVIIGKLKEKSLPANAISYKKIVSFGPYLEPELIDWRPPNNDDPQFLIYSGSSGVPKGVLWGAGFLTHAHRWVESIAQAFIPKLASAPKAIFSPRRGKDKIVLMLLRSFVFRKLISKPAVQQLAIKLVTRSYRTVSQGHLKRAANRAKLSRSTPNITLLVGDLAKGKNWFHCFFTLLAGDPVVLLENSQTDAKEIWYTVEKRSVRTLIIAGDLHARALAKILEDISCDTGSLAFIHSVGTPWSVVSKRKLLDFIPQAIFVDNYAVAEGLVFSQVSLSTDRLIESMQFDWSDRVVLLSEEGDPMSGLDDSTGELALSDMIPISYWRDDQRTETNFIDLDGKAYVKLDDMAKRTANGKLLVLGAGENCVTIDGEKVFPEEVENVIRELPEVIDCAIVVADDGHQHRRILAGVVQLKENHVLEAEEIVAHCQKKLATYKAPNYLALVKSVPRRDDGRLVLPTVRLMVERMGLKAS